MRRSSWCDDLPPEALAVLDSAEADECSDAAFERMGKRLAVGLGVGAAVAGAAGTAQATTGTVTAGATLGGHALTTWLGLVLGVGMTITAVQVLRPEAAEVAPTVVSTSPSTPTVTETHGDDGPESTPATPTRAPERAHNAPSELPVEAPAPHARPLPGGPTSSATVTVTAHRSPVRSGARPTASGMQAAHDVGIPTQRSPSRLAEELSLMRRLRSAVHHDPRHALGLASEHASRFGDGSSFSAERELYRVQALARLGEHARAETRARQFRQRFPGSPYGAAIEAALRSNAVVDSRPVSP